MLAPPEHRKHTDIAAPGGRRGSAAPCSRPPRQPGSPGSPREKSALLPGRVPAVDLSLVRPARAASPLPGCSLAPRSRRPCFFLTFLGSDREPPGMIRNTWPLGAAGAQEIRTLELGKNQGSRLENKHRFRGWGVPLWGCLPCFLGPGRVRISCLWRAPPCPGVTGGSLERELEGRARKGTGKETKQLDGKAPGESV